MSDDYLQRIEAKLDGLTAGFGEVRRDITELKTDVSELKTDVGVLKTDVGELKTDVGVLKTDVGGLKTDVGVLKTDVDGLKGGQARLEFAVEELRAAQMVTNNGLRGLRDHMGVLHEDVLGRISALGEDDSLRREMHRGFADLREAFGRHADPGDAADRSHAARLHDHERRLIALEGEARPSPS